MQKQKVAENTCRPGGWNGTRCAEAKRAPAWGLIEFFSIILIFSIITSCGQDDSVKQLLTNENCKSWDKIIDTIPSKTGIVYCKDSLSFFHYLGIDKDVKVYYTRRYKWQYKGDSVYSWDGDIELRIVYLTEDSMVLRPNISNSKAWIYIPSKSQSMPIEPEKFQRRYKKVR